MVAQHMARAPFDHAVGQAEVDHPRQRDFQCLVAGDRLYPGPEVQHRLGASVGDEVLQIAIGGVDDIVDLFGRQVSGQREILPRQCLAQRFVQRLFVAVPAFGLGSEENVDRHELPRSMNMRRLNKAEGQEQHQHGRTTIADHR